VRLIALDLRDVTFIDSSGLHLIVDASTRARQVGRRLVLLRGSPNVDRLLALTGTTTVVEIAEVDPSQSPAQALRELACPLIPPPQCRAPGPSLDPPSPGEVPAPQPEHRGQPSRG
jgi:hypothetical protein